MGFTLTISTQKNHNKTIGRNPADDRIKQLEPQVPTLGWAAWPTAISSVARAAQNRNLEPTIAQCQLEHSTRKSSPPLLRRAQRIRIAAELPRRDVARTRTQWNGTRSRNALGAIALHGRKSRAALYLIPYTLYLTSSGQCLDRFRRLVASRLAVGR